VKKLLIICILIISIIFISGCISEKPESVFEKENALPEEEWNRLFGGNSADYADSVQQTLDGGYIVAGETFENALLIKTDANGIEQWNKTFIGSGGGAKSVQQTSDGGFILIGGATATWLIKTDINGNQQWKKRFKCGSTFRGASIQKTSDGGYIIANECVTKTDINGNEQWNKTFGSKWQIIYYASSIQQTSDGGYIVAGDTKFYNGDVAGVAWIIKTDSQGNEQWNRTLGRSGNYGSSSVQQTLDGGYVVGGYNGIRLIKTDVNGIEQWNRTFGGLASSVKQTSDDGYIVAGSSIMLVGAGLIKLDANGNEQWNMTFGKRSDKINSVQMTSDGGYILAGNNYSNRLSDAWLIKVSREPTEFERKRR